MLLPLRDPLLLPFSVITRKKYSQRRGAAKIAEGVKHPWQEYNFWVSFDGTENAIGEKNKLIYGWENA